MPNKEIRVTFSVPEHGEYQNKNICIKIIQNDRHPCGCPYGYFLAGSFANNQPNMSLIEHESYKDCIPYDMRQGDTIYAFNQAWEIVIGEKGFPSLIWTD